jgi:hypothetical protein
VAGPDDQTRVVDSQSDRVSKEAGSDGPPSGIEFIGKTKFTEVQDTDRRRSTIAPAPSEETTSWGQWIGITTLSIALLACIAALVVLLQSPSANVLYADVAAAIEANEEEQWLASETSALRFKELYPNDARIADVDAAIAEIESIRAVRSLQRKARRGTADQLPAIEQAYLECLKAQSIDAAMGKIMLPTSIQAKLSGSASNFQKSVQTQPLLILGVLIAVYLVLGVMLGGRVGYALFYDQGLVDPIKILKVWEGGLSFHGGLAGVAIASHNPAVPRGTARARARDTSPGFVRERRVRGEDRARR